jgi:hypothetical protein
MSIPPRTSPLCRAGWGELPVSVVSCQARGFLASPNRYRARSRPRSSLSSAFSVRFPLRRIDTDNEHDHDRKTNADTPYADTPTRFPRRRTPNAERRTLPQLTCAETATRVGKLRSARRPHSDLNQESYSELDSAPGDPSDASLWRAISLPWG